MTIRGLLLRLMLSLSLAFNGMASAMAATHVHEMASQFASLEGEGCCAEHSDTSGDHATHAPVDTQSKHDSCNGSVCTCACPHAAQAALIDPLLLTPTMAQALYVGGLSLAHPAPALLHLIRPPIDQRV